MQPMPASVMIGQIEDYPNILRDQVGSYDQAARKVFSTLEYRSFRHVVVTGDGDSFHAAHAVELAFENIAGVVCEPMSAQRFLSYGADWLTVPAPRHTLVIGVSASGGTQRVVQALTRAREQGATTLAITCTPGSAVTEAAEAALISQLSDFGPSPGLRTFEANLINLYLVAIRIGEIRGRFTQDEANAMRVELSQLSEPAAATIQATKDLAKSAAATLGDAALMTVVGSGPSYGTALFSAAKIVEAAGVMAVGQDLEEWAHVERFAYPLDMPTIIISPDGRSHWRAVDLAKSAKSLGRRVVVVCKDGDAELAESADMVWPVMGDCREEFSPLLYNIAVSFFSSYLADHLGRMLFQTDRL
ncbi:MAG: SIS domain-containing protein [Thermomicrobiales bacterium]|nr:SIS domain-containing protein [Thermomicrobiales bacterium]